MGNDRNGVSAVGSLANALQFATTAKVLADGRRRDDAIQAKMDAMDAANDAGLETAGEIADMRRVLAKRREPDALDDIQETEKKHSLIPGVRFSWE